MSSEWSGTLHTGLKEWAVVCSALESGRQVLLLRKGGIAESNGEFEIEHRRFLLFPTYLHQKRDSIKSNEQAGLDLRDVEPSRVRLSAAAEITDIIALSDRAQMDGLEDRHIWTPSLIDMRFNYRPYNPLYLLLARVWRLPEAVEIDNSIDYAGCKSWVPLEAAVDVGRASPVLSDDDYQNLRRDILEKIKK